MIGTCGALIRDEPRFVAELVRGPRSRDERQSPWRRSESFASGGNSYLVIHSIVRSQPSNDCDEASINVDYPNIPTADATLEMKENPVDEELLTRMAALRPALSRYFVRSVGAQADAEDLVQEVYLRIVRRRTFDTYVGFASYAFLTADSVLKDRNRRRVVRMATRHVSYDPDIHRGDQPSLERELVARDQLRATSAALAQLPDRTRSVFALRRLDGLSYLEIGSRLGISVSSAEKHMLRATRHLLAATRDPT